MTLKCRFLIVAFIVFSVSFIFRINVIANLFVLDDFTLIIGNTFVHSLNNILEVLNPKNIFYVLPIRCGARPLTVASLIIDYSAFGVNPFGYHVVNLLIHSVNSVLVFVFVYFLNYKKTIIYPLIASLFFSLHPIQSEVSNVISFRADLLLVFFYLVTLNSVNFLQQYYKQNKLLYVLIFIIICFAFFTKENAIILPIALLLFSVFLYEDKQLKKFAIISFVVIIFFFLFFWITRFPVPLFYTIYPNLDGNITPLVNFFTYFNTIITALFYNIMHVLYPVNLSVDYVVKSSVYVYIAILIFVLLIVYLFFYKIKDKNVKFLILLTILTYLPISNVIPLVNTVADRYMYMPMVAISILFGLVIYKIISKVNKRITYAFVIGLFSLYVIISYQRGESYNNSYTLYSDAIVKNPNNIRTIYNMGVAYFSNEEYDKAILEFNKVSKINPIYMRDKIWFLTAMSYDKQNNKNSAQQYYYKAFLLNPLDDEIADNFIYSFSSFEEAKKYILAHTVRLDDNIYTALQKRSKI